mmetsp:Transcript_26721/g.78702  ORF Transcript_26721/g.78702 Transcript_26721/m.78702 type:complete len:241 (-) Transcript_26721:560-1282(-)
MDHVSGKRRQVRRLLCEARHIQHGLPERAASRGPARQVQPAQGDAEQDLANVRHGPRRQPDETGVPHRHAPGHARCPGRAAAADAARVAPPRAVGREHTKRFVRGWGRQPCGPGRESLRRGARNANAGARGRAAARQRRRRRRRPRSELAGVVRGAGGRRQLGGHARLLRGREQERARREHVQPQRRPAGEGEFLRRAGRGLWLRGGHGRARRGCELGQRRIGGAWRAARGGPWRRRRRL